ncbi:MAG: HPF/RaiA family ribosome-associated protein [Gemmatimonadota bacterium]
MQIQVNTDRNITGHADMIAQVQVVVENALSRFSAHITRVEVHLSDENSDKKSGVNDMRCVMEARLERRKPVAVTEHATTVEQAVEGAAHKLARLVESARGREHDKSSR